MVKRIGFWGGLLLFFWVLLANPPADMPSSAWYTAACTVLLVIWWITEPIPVPVTSLLPLILFPLMGIFDIDDAASAYSDPAIFLFLGGFMMALAMQKSKLHLRVALFIVRLIGTDANAIIGGFMLATALLSLWISNTATAAMMLPMGMSMVTFLMDEMHMSGTRRQKERFALCLMLGIAYAATIGGVGTLVGTPTNVFFVGFMRDQYDIDISFASWLLVGLPFVVVMLGLTWWLLNFVIYPCRLGQLPNAGIVIENEQRKLGPVTKQEKRVAVVFLVTASLWIFRSPINAVVPGASLTDPMIAVIAIFLLFIIPVHRRSRESLLSWADTKELPWGIVLLFGGGLAIAAAFSATGLADWIGIYIQSLNIQSIVLLGFVVVVTVIVLSELMSNIAVITLFLPIIGSIANAFEAEPTQLAILATIAASCSFTMPISTAPNAIVYSSGYVRLPQMAIAGIILNLVAIALIMLLAVTLVPLVAE